MLRRPFFRYPGSKWILSKHYPAPAHGTIIEPFAGSACYSTRYADRNVILVEKDPEVAELWKYLISANGNDIAQLPTSELSVGQDIRELDVPIGAKLLIRSWQRVGMSKCWTISKWNNLNSGLWSNSARDSVAASVEHIRHWSIFCQDYTRSFDFWNKLATWFIDPPYHGLPLFGSKLIDYAALADFCQTRPGQAIVCEQDSATWLPFVPFRKVVTGRRGQPCSNGKSSEGIWTSP